MKKINIISFACFLFLTSMLSVSKVSNLSPVLTKAAMTVAESNNDMELAGLWIDSMYSMLKLEKAGLTKEAFAAGCKGYEYLLSENKLKNSSLLTICDYSKCSTIKRLFVIDMVKGKMLFKTYASHGRNSGAEYATSFSNSNDSHKTSLGFMITGETYVGGNGYSMRFDGVENNINNNVRNRAIVMHGGEYVSEERANAGTMMGRSYGCPAVPLAENKKIIDCIKGGSCFFAYYPDPSYFANSSILKAEFQWPVTLGLKKAAPYLANSSSTVSKTEEVATNL